MPAAPPASRLAPKAALAIRAAIRLAGGREVCFVCTLDANGQGAIETARVVARGDATCVLALPGFAQRGEMLVHNHPSGLLEPSAADLDVAARIHDEGVGFGIVNNAATELYVVVEVPTVAEQTLLDPRAIDRDLGVDGPIAARLQRYEDRASQREMAVAIAHLYNDGGVGLLEAGTGVGKSLGYLVPALRWAAANGERTVVSTNTINLQEQLVGRDLPFLAGALTDQPVRFALLKGWRNYVCLLRLEQARAAGSALFEDGLQNDLDAIEGWAQRTADGSLSDLPSQPRPEVWDEVAAEPDLCLRFECPKFDRCFVFKARKEAAQADVIVVNHHLLLSDVAVRRASQNWDDAAVLPAYSRLVIDEGHHLEDAAAGHLGTSVTRRGLHRLFNRLERRGRGMLPTLVARLEAGHDLLSAASLDLVQSRLSPSVHAARDKGELLFDLLDDFLQQSGQPVLRLTDEFADHPIWRAGLRRTLDDALEEIEILDGGLRVVRDRMDEAGVSGSHADDGVAPVINEIRGVLRRLQAAGDGLRQALDPPPGEPTVRWIEARGAERGVAAATVPLNLAPILRENLFKRTVTTVVTSATLAAAGQSAGERRFEFLTNRLGLNDPELATCAASFPSPFDYESNAILAIPTDVPAPNVDPAGHFASVARIAVDLAAASDGGLFVLFTSHRELRAMAVELRGRGAVTGGRRWPILVHGEEARDPLLARFRDSGRAILLGTASFWEGVDVPGHALRGLVIARLPFRVPTEPVTAAQCEAIAARGGDPFQEYMVPHAGLRLKQGFGRLIRTATDRGTIVIADSRIVTKSYGKELIEGLPSARRLIAPWQRLIVEIRRFHGHTTNGEEESSNSSVTRQASECP